MKNFNVFELKEIKEFAFKNMSLDESEQLCIFASLENEDVALTNPWIDRSARFELSDEDAVKEWGLLNVINFIMSVAEYLYEE